jgi:tRNA A-37 threonylcarbamoyl transferase component Bud32
MPDAHTQSSPGATGRPRSGTPSAADWRRIAALFEAAVDLPRPERATLIDRECGADVAVRFAVEALLERHDGVPSPGAQAADAPPQPAPESLVGRRLAHYDVHRLIGRGGMGVVYQAWDTSLAREVAIKVLQRDVADDAVRCDRLRLEARAAAALVHPGIATVFSFETAGGEVFLVTEYVEGRTLRQMLDEGPLPRARLIAISLDIARALAAAHARGVVHRDLKPDNILLPEAGGVKIVDFGLARIDAPQGDRTTVLENLSRAGTLVGTPAYMAPEQIDARVADFRADIFAFGIVLYEMATSRHPFAGRSLMSTMANVLVAEPAPLSSTPDAWLGALDAIVRRCLQKSRERRYDSTARLVEDLERLDAQGASARAPSVAGIANEAPAGAARFSARWWWRTHQVVVSIVDAIALVPLWWALAHSSWGGVGRAVFFVGLAAAVVEVTLRLHLSFVARFQAEAIDRQRRRLRPALAAAHAVLLLTLLAGVAAAFSAQPGLASVLFIIATALFLAAVVIEPTTTRAAFDAER